MSIEKYLDGRSVWIGTKPVHVAEVIDLIQNTNMRAPQTMHGRFDSVWLYEQELFSYGSGWPIVLDECIRLLGRQGRIIVRTRDSAIGTLFELKSFISRRPGLVSELLFQQVLQSGDTISVIEVQRQNIKTYTDNSWTIGILSNGAKSSNVLALVEKVVRLAGTRSLQVLIAGPERPALPTTVTSACHEWVDRQNDILPRIGEKKNWIIKEACNENIAIFHDRYQIDDNFFVGFDEFGLDFDFASICQRYESGVYYPSYIGFSELKMRWQRPVFDPSYCMLHDGHFVNGGLIVIKRNIAAEINFNSLLLHNEAEDVELSFHLRSHGILPRMNSRSSAIAIGVSDTYTASFINLNEHKPLVLQTKKSVGVSIRQIVFAVWHRLPDWSKQLIRNTRFYVIFQRYLHSH